MFLFLLKLDGDSRESRRHRGSRQVEGGKGTSPKPKCRQGTPKPEIVQSETLGCFVISFSVELGFVLRVVDAPGRDRKRSRLGSGRQRDTSQLQKRVVLTLPVVRTRKRESNEISI